MPDQRTGSHLRDPFSGRAIKICARSINRADSLGMEHYGPAPAPLDEKRDMYQEAIGELLDAIYYLTRQIARLEDQRERMKGVAGTKPTIVYIGQSTQNEMAYARGHGKPVRFLE